MLNPNDKKIVGFCFPKLPMREGVSGKKLCVVELKVYWKGFKI